VVTPRRPRAGDDPRGRRAGFRDDGTVDGYRLSLSTAVCDPEWDRFLEATPGGHHLQSTYWGEVKSILGWRSVRVLVTCDGAICGGAQILLRRLPVLGSVGYVPLGPVLATDDPVPRDLILRGVQAVARRQRVLLLVVQPPIGQDAVARDLLLRGFREARDALRPLPTATLLVDLSRDEEALLAGMKNRTRYSIRLAQRKGVEVRQGGEQDLDTFYRLLAMTGERQHFPVPAQGYFRDLLRFMAPHGHAKIFIAEFEGQPLSAALVIAFGDVVSYKRGGWSGQQGHLHPNELMHWTAMRWAKQQGYRYYDFEGIELSQIAPGGGTAIRSVSAFKAGFGGDVVLLPGAYEWIHNPVLRRGYYWLGNRLLDSVPARRVINTVRTR
jgi:lipid II:glycine glycyltransferase (peptidoglycan interpeptide bridge formation enzyme)